MRHSKALRAALLIAGLLAFVAAAVCLCRSGLPRRIASVREVRAMIDRAGPLAWLVFFLLQMMTVILAPIPSNVTMAAGALALGFARALVFGVLAILAGSMLVFLLARKLGRGAVQRLVDRGVLDKYLPLIEEKEDMFLFLTLLFPFFPDDTICILAGLTSIPTARFALIMMVSRPWGLVFAALVGSGAIALPAWGWAALAAVMAVVFALGLKYSRPIEDALLRVCARLSHRRREKP